MTNLAQQLPGRYPTQFSAYRRICDAALRALRPSRVPLLLGLSLALLWNAQAADDAPLRVGVSPVSPPMVFKEGNTLAGIDVDFAMALGQELGRPVKFVEVKWEDQIDALQEGRTDIIMSGMSMTRARQVRVAFADPYLQVGQATLIRREDSSRYLLGFPPQLPGAVGVRKATTGDYLVQQEFPRAKRKEYKSAEDGAKALVKKNIDLYISDAPIVWWLAGLYEEKGLVVVPIMLSDEKLAWAVRRSDAQLLDSVNKALRNLRDSGRDKTIIRRWLPQFK